MKLDNVTITAITPPETGWPIVAHCALCRKTVIVLSLYAAKPEKGDYWLLKGTCLDEENNMQHNLWPQYDDRPAFRVFSWEELAREHRHVNVSRFGGGW